MLAAENQVVLDVPSNKPFEREALKAGEKWELRLNTKHCRNHDK
jgi:hypothetical protein